ncbi:flagellar hook assembly protein FlgD [Desulfococcus sp.]|uniref:flagellar hook assembly protein FlgD n=1 Tax=Desulfococcus sp. TaxID=2025834 RepID=UPI0035946D3D
MSVSGVNPVVPSRDTGTAVKTDELGQDDFLNLLIAQLQAQDPLNPLESAEFSAQLAQFNSLEKLMEVNTHLEELKAAQLFSANAQFVDYIGKTVKAQGNTVALTEGEPLALSFDLARNAKSVSVNIFDAGGLRVRTLTAEETGAGEQSVEWNGKDDKGRRVPDGTYRFEAAAVDEAGAAVEATPFTLNRVTGVTFQNDSAVLLAQNHAIPLSQVVRVSETESR